MVLPAMNGVPWWFLPAALAGASRRSKASIPAARCSRALPLARVLGCVVHLRRLVPGAGRRPARLRRAADRRRAGRRRSRRASAAVCAALAEAGFEAEASADVRREVWYKLWGNMTMNPVSALTGATTDAILDDPLVHAFMLRTHGRGGGDRRPASAARSPSRAKSGWR